MARFSYLGEIPPHGGMLVSQGPCLHIMLPLKNGTTQTISAPDQVNGFTIGNDIGVDITDQRALRVLRADVRFQEL